MLVGFLLLLTILSTSIFTLWTIWLSKLILIDQVAELGNFTGVVLAVLFSALSIFTIYYFWKNRKNITYFDVCILVIILLVSVCLNSLFILLQTPLPSLRNVTFISTCKSLNEKKFSVEEMLKLNGWCSYDLCTTEAIHAAMDKVKSSEREAVYIYTDRATAPHLTCTFTQTEPEMQTSMYYYSD